MQESLFKDYVKGKTFMYISEIICVILQCEERILIRDYVNTGSCDIKKIKMETWE